MSKTSKIESVVRVGINNNFNCTKDEFQQVQGFQLVSPKSSFFINTNVKTPGLLKLNQNDCKAVITVNPDMVIKRALVNKLYKLKKENVSFVRVKYLPHNKEVVELIKELSGKGYNVVVTAMRFISNRTVKKYSKKEYYNYDHSWFRLKPELFSELEKLADSLEGVYICDRKGLGCSDCGLCSELTTGENLDLQSLNLSSSGICPFNCVDCYAKKMQNFLIGVEKSPIIYDCIRKNGKQKGNTKHIKKNRKKMEG